MHSHYHSKEAFKAMHDVTLLSALPGCAAGAVARMTQKEEVLSSALFSLTSTSLFGWKSCTIHGLELFDCLMCHRSHLASLIPAQSLNTLQQKRRSTATALQIAIPLQ
jgi:hypothetical protein